MNGVGYVNGIIDNTDRAQRENFILVRLSINIKTLLCALLVSWKIRSVYVEGLI